MHCRTTSRSIGGGIVVSILSLSENSGESCVMTDREINGSGDLPKRSRSPDSTEWIQLLQPIEFASK